MKKIVCYGEVLWDCFGESKKLGGAPFNVAARLQSLGNDTYVISSVGNDQSGKDLLNKAKEYGVNLNAIQIHPSYSTSRVLVSLDDKGVASYNIEAPCAWDGIEFNQDINYLVSSSDALVFGSLVSRNHISRDTLLKLLEIPVYKIFDLNLRPPHYSTKLILELMNNSDFIKFNDEELLEMAKSLNFKDDNLEKCILFIADLTNTETICVTLGAKGAILYRNGKFYFNSGYKVEVVDTVGAGDSFLASLIASLLDNQDSQKSIDYACAVGALVASSSGANPIISEEKILAFLPTDKV